MTDKFFPFIAHGLWKGRDNYVGQPNVHIAACIVFSPPGDEPRASFMGRTVETRGYNIVAYGQFYGRVDNDFKVEINKRLIGGQTVNYTGTLGPYRPELPGSGFMAGEWKSGSETGSWSWSWGNRGPAPGEGRLETLYLPVNSPDAVTTVSKLLKGRTYVFRISWGWTPNVDLYDGYPYMDAFYDLSPRFNGGEPVMHKNFLINDIPVEPHPALSPNYRYEIHFPGDNKKVSFSVLDIGTGGYANNLGRLRIEIYQGPCAEGLFSDPPAMLDEE